MLKVRSMRNNRKYYRQQHYIDLEFDNALLRGTNTGRLWLINQWKKVERLESMRLADNSCTA